MVKPRVLGKRHKALSLAWMVSSFFLLSCGGSNRFEVDPAVDFIKNTYGSGTQEIKFACSVGPSTAAGIDWSPELGFSRESLEDAWSKVCGLTTEISIPEPLDTSGALAIGGSFAYGQGECAPNYGSSEQVQEFADAPKLCISPTKTYTALISTNKGDLTVVLDPTKAPGTVNNFVNLARSKYFDNTVCHRAIPTFVVQCGDPTATGSGGPGYTFSDELPGAGEYKIGSLAMANSGPNTNGSQFFIITGEQGVTLPPNYTLFGQVTKGLDTTLPALDKAGNDDPATNGVPPKEELRIMKVTISER